LPRTTNEGMVELRPEPGCLPLEDVPYTHLPFPLVRPPDAYPETATKGAASSVGTGRTGEC